MKSVLAALLAFGLVACSPTPPSGSDTGAASAPTPATPAPTSASSAGAAVGDTASRLDAYHWRLSNAMDQAGQRLDALFVRADQPLQLDFAAGNLAISNTCNRMRGSYVLAGGKLTLGHFASTMMACQDPQLMALDSAVGKYFAGTLQLALTADADKPQLTLTTDQGDTLEFTGVATPETRYGGSGETMFLEVAPQTAACQHPGMTDAQCLSVRELHYGDNGLRSGEPGPWHMLDQPIEGYTHEAGTRNVLRVKRYAIANPPADASSAAYVLDMVVESGR